MREKAFGTKPGSASNIPGLPASFWLKNPESGNGIFVGITIFDRTQVARIDSGSYGELVKYFGNESQEFIYREENVKKDLSPIKDLTPIKEMDLQQEMKSGMGQATFDAG
jgi:hypothetical protein